MAILAAPVTALAGAIFVLLAQKIDARNKFVEEKVAASAVAQV